MSVSSTRHGSNNTSLILGSDTRSPPGTEVDGNDDARAAVEAQADPTGSQLDLEVQHFYLTETAPERPEARHNASATSLRSFAQAAAAATETAQSPSSTQRQGGSVPGTSSSRNNGHALQQSQALAPALEAYVHDHQAHERLAVDMNPPRGPTLNSRRRRRSRRWLTRHFDALRQRGRSQRPRQNGGGPINGNDSNERR